MSDIYSNNFINVWNCPQILTQRDDDGFLVEPYSYLPVIPMALVNGCHGIGTGFSSSIPSYNPIDIISNIERALNNDELIAMTPWYRGFQGQIVPTESNNKNLTNFKSLGRIARTGRTSVRITELPVGVWTRGYKSILNKAMSGGTKKGLMIKKYTEHQCPFGNSYQGSSNIVNQTKRRPVN